MHNITTDKKQQEVNNNIKNSWEETCQFTKCLLVIGGCERGVGWKHHLPWRRFQLCVVLYPIPPLPPPWLTLHTIVACMPVQMFSQPYPFRTDCTEHKLHTELRWPGSCSAPQQTADFSGRLSSLWCLSVQNWVVSHSFASLLSSFSQKKIGWIRILVESECTLSRCHWKSYIKAVCEREKIECTISLELLLICKERKEIWW